MKKLALALILAASLALGACGSNVGKVESNGDGTCTQERSKTFLGLEYSSTQNIQNCDR